MTTITPSVVVQAIDAMFGPQRNELDMHLVQAVHRDDVNALLTLLGDVPRALIQLPASDYVTFNRCQASLAGALAVWSTTITGPPARQVEGRDPIATIRRLLSICPDELPPPILLDFVGDLETRRWLIERGSAAWTDFGAGDWLGASVMAGAALEGLLLWGLKNYHEGPPSKQLNGLGLKDLIDRAHREGLIDDEEKSQAMQAADVRNLVHLGRLEKREKAVTRGHALAALAAVDLVTTAMARRGGSQR